MKVIKIILVIWIAICVLSIASYVKVLVSGEKINENLEIKREACKYRNADKIHINNESTFECIRRYQLLIDERDRNESNR